MEIPKMLKPQKPKPIRLLKVEVIEIIKEVDGVDQGFICFDNDNFKKHAKNYNGLVSGLARSYSYIEYCN